MNRQGEIPTSENRRIAAAAGVVSALTLLSRITGLLRDVVISYLFGAGALAEAFFVAFRFPNLFRRLVAEGAMSVAFVPVFSDLMVRRQRVEVETALRALLGSALLVLIVLSGFGVLFAPQIVGIFAPGFAEVPEVQAPAISLTRILFPYLTLIGLVAVMAGFLNASRHFIAPALSPAVLNVAIITSALLLYAFFETPIFALAYGVILGGLAQLFLQIVVLKWRGVRLRPAWKPRHDAVVRTMRLLGPVLIGTAVLQINVLFATALASLLPIGSVSYLWYADRIFEFPLGLFVAALGTAALPSLATQAARGDHAEMRDTLGFALGLTNFVAIPATVGLITLADPIVAVLFERGAFSAADTVLTASALRAYAVGLWSAAASRLLAPAFYALGDARTPMLAAAAAVVTNIVASLALMGTVSATAQPAWLAAVINSLSLADFGHIGLALATSIGGAVNLLILAVLLWKRLGAFAPDAIFGSLARSVAATLPMAVVVLGGKMLLADSLAGAAMASVLAVVALVAAGVGTFLFTAYLIGGVEVDRARRLVGEFVRRSKLIVRL